VKDDVDHVVLARSMSMPSFSLSQSLSLLPPVFLYSNTPRLAFSISHASTSPIRFLTKIQPLASPLHRLRSLSTRGGIAAETVGRGVAMQPAVKRQRPPDALGDEMKQYEAETCNAMVDTSRPCVVRLDGHWCVVLSSY